MIYDNTSKTLLICFVSLVVFSILAGAAAADASLQGINIYSAQSLDYEITDNLNNNIPVFVYFYTDWCHFCQQQSPIIDELESDYAGRIAFIRINKDESPQAAAEFGVDAIPNMFLITKEDETGQIIYKNFRGLINKTLLNSNMEQVIARSGPSVAETVQSHENPSTLLVLIIILVGIAAFLLFVLKI